jgi:hypothetical protein
MPRFGGYDPMAVARGISVRGHTLFGWSKQWLYLFYSAAARTTSYRPPAASSRAQRANGPRSRAHHFALNFYILPPVNSRLRPP